MEYRAATCDRVFCEHRRLTMAMRGLFRRRRRVPDNLGASDTGSAIVTLVGACAIAGVLGGTVFMFAFATGRVAFVSQVADQAALAAADAQAGLLPGQAPCVAASLVASQNGIRVEACNIEGETVVVTVVDDSALVVSRASARAGPSSLLP